MNVMEDGCYEQARQRLMTDPIVIGMAEDVKADPKHPPMTHWDGRPTWDFTLAAVREYAKRGGKDSGHIGAVSEAIVRLLKR